jgi:DNA-binding transcriptional ArsR family regulator
MGYDPTPSAPFAPEPVAMKDPLQPTRCAEMLAALAAPERLRIIRFLSDGPHNVTEIAEMLHSTAVNVSHHLGVLRHANLVNRRKQGRFVLYSLCPGVLVPEEETGPTARLDLGCCRLELPQPVEAPARRDRRDAD